MRNKRKHSLLGVSIHNRNPNGTLNRTRRGITPLDRISLIFANTDLGGLPSDFNKLPQHEKLLAIKKCGVRFTPRYS